MSSLFLLSSSIPEAFELLLSFPANAVLTAAQDGTLFVSEVIVDVISVLLASASISLSLLFSAVVKSFVDKHLPLTGLTQSSLFRLFNKVSNSAVKFLSDKTLSPSLATNYNKPQI